MEQLLGDEDKQRLAGLMKIDHQAWRSTAEGLADDELIDLIRFFAVAENLPGWEAGAESPVIPLVVGEDLAAFKMTMRLQEEGVFANPVVSPGVPPGRAMIRTSYMATHTRDHLDRALEAFQKVGRELGVIE